MTATIKAQPKVLPRQQVLTRDGIGLVTDIYLPDRVAACPTVIMRTPYGRHMMFLLLLTQRLTRAGYAVVLQDSRGRYQSGGKFDIDREESDSHDTLAWIAEQGWCDGRVALVGISLSSFANFLTAAKKTVAGIQLCSMVSIMGSVDVHALFFEQGALLHHWALPWSALIAKGNLGKKDWQEHDWPALLGQLPIATAPAAAGGDLELWGRVVGHPASEEGWRAFSAEGRYDDIHTPTLHVGGWFDFMLPQTVRGFRGMHAGLQGQHRRRGHHRLVVGPWDHNTVFMSFGARAKSAGPNRTSEDGNLDLMEMAAGWLGRWFDDRSDHTETGPTPTDNAPTDNAPTGNTPEQATQDLAAREFDHQPDVLLFLVGQRRWLAADAFPLDQAETLDLFLVSGGRANSAAGDGRLETERPTRLGQDRFAYDPHDPVPTLGGAVWPFPPAKLSPGPADQSLVEQRTDVLVYTGEPLANDLVVIGPVELELTAASSAADTDFTAKLVDTDPAGVPRIVQDGIVRARFGTSRAEEKLAPPHRPQRYTIDLKSVAYRFKAGHRIRLEVASSNFPKYDRNLNTARPSHTATDSVVAQQTVFHGGAMASRLRLPVVSAEKADALHWKPPKAWRAQ